MQLTKFLGIFIVYSLEDEKSVTIILGLFWGYLLRAKHLIFLVYKKVIMQRKEILLIYFKIYKKCKTLLHTLISNKGHL